MRKKHLIIAEKRGGLSIYRRTACGLSYEGPEKLLKVDATHNTPEVTCENCKFSGEYAAAKGGGYAGKYKILLSGRIQALKSFRNVTKGDIGGFIESEQNLSSTGNCWVYDNARVSGPAMVSGDASVCENAQVYDNTFVEDNACVAGNARVFGNALIYGHAYVGGDAYVFDNVMIHGGAHIGERARVFGNAEVFGNAGVHGETCIGGNTKLIGRHG